MHISKIPTRAPEDMDKEKTKLETQKILEKISYYQRMMYAQGEQSILLILQGMDAAGKDGTIKDIFTGINPLGCSVTAFKAPTKEELSHDFLWRIHQHAPEKGMIKIFNRSHYEDILVPTVEDLFSKDEIEKRYEHINNFEELLTDSGVKIIKCYLHISREEQKERLQERLELPHKFWKHNDHDWESREKWDDYMNVYEDIFKKCDTVPRHIISADQNRWKVHQIATLLLETFESMDLSRPGLDTEMFVVD